MSDMKCPFCQQELESVLQLAGAGGLVEEAYLLCSKCNIRGERKLWQALIDTKKKLDIAVELIRKIDSQRTVSRDALHAHNVRMLNPGIVFCWTTPDEIHNALKQITALEQKE